MEANPKQQILRSLKNAQNILLLSHKHIDGDGLSSMIALSMVLKKLGKKVTAYTPDPIPSMLQFLPDIEEHTSSSLEALSDFIIYLDCTHATIEKLRYNVVDNKVKIVITPKEGQFESTDVRSEKGKPHFDTIITLDTGDMEHLGSIYTEHPDIFHESVVLNIDHHVTNTFYGTTNLVDPKATSTCEIILGLIESLESQYSEKLLDQTIATHLLTGITVDTNSFQNSNTTPKSFSVAAQLLALGADQQMIIKNLYKTHSLNKLKLWGRALSNIRQDQEAKLVWSVISKRDFDDVAASEEDISGLIDELMTSAPGADLVFILREQPDDTVNCSIRSVGEADAGKLALFFNGGGHKKAAGFKVKGDSLEKIENYVVKKFREYQFGNLEKEKEEKLEATKISNAEETKSFISQVQEQSKKENYDNKEDLPKKTFERPPINRAE